jgi:hypothetical protein
MSLNKKVCTKCLKAANPRADFIVDRIDIHWKQGYVGCPYSHAKKWHQHRDGQFNAVEIGSDVPEYCPYALEHIVS